MEDKQKTFDWWKKRLGMIGASEVSICYQEPRSKADDLTKTQIAFIDKKAVELHLLKQPDEKLQILYETEQEKMASIPDVVRGNEHEEYARMLFENKTSIIVEQTGFHTCNQTALGASPDGLFYIGKRFFNMEIKCPRLENHYATIFTQIIKPEYMLQMLAQSYVCQTNSSMFVSFCAEAPEHHQLFIKRIEWEDEQFEELIKKVEKFTGLIEHRYQQIARLNESALGFSDANLNLV